MSIVGFFFPHKLVESKSHTGRKMTELLISSQSIQSSGMLYILLS